MCVFLIANNLQGIRMSTPVASARHSKFIDFVVVYTSAKMLSTGAFRLQVQFNFTHSTFELDPNSLYIYACHGYYVH